MSAADFIEIAATPEPKKVADLSRAELVDIVHRIKAAQAESEQQYYMALFDAQVTLPAASLLLFHPPAKSRVPPNRWNPTPQEVVDLALAHTPIAL